MGGGPIRSTSDACSRRQVAVIASDLTDAAFVSAGAFAL
jgi:hypothetical protein